MGVLLGAAVAACAGATTTEGDTGIVAPGGGGYCPKPGYNQACTTNYDCEGFTCNLVSNTCETFCAGEGWYPTCQVGLVCHANNCVRPGTCGTCSSDFECQPYKCDTGRGQCTSSCGTDFDCAFGSHCVSMVCQ